MVFAQIPGLTVPPLDCLNDVPLSLLATANLIKRERQRFNPTFAKSQANWETCIERAVYKRHAFCTCSVKIAVDLFVEDCELEQ